MSREQWTAVDDYFTKLLVRPDDALAAVLSSSAIAGLPAINVSPNQGKLLYILARLQGARRILEIGTLAGYSAIWLGRALPADGQLISLESDQKHADMARANIARAGLGKVVDIRIGLAQDTLPALLAEGAGPFDLIFIDADKPSYPEYLAWSLKLTRVGSIIVADNVVRNGAVIDANNTDATVRGVRRFNELLASESRLCATAIQTVGGKGYDGFAVALVVA